MYDQYYIKRVYVQIRVEILPDYYTGLILVVRTTITVYLAIFCVYL